MRVQGCGRGFRHQFRPHPTHTHKGTAWPPVQAGCSSRPAHAQVVTWRAPVPCPRVRPRLSPQVHLIPALNDSQGRDCVCRRITGKTSARSALSRHRRNVCPPQTTCSVWPEAPPAHPPQPLTQLKKQTKSNIYTLHETHFHSGQKGV